MQINSRRSRGREEFNANPSSHQYARLLEERGELADAMDQVLEVASTEGRELTADESATLDDGQERLSELRALIARHEVEREKIREAAGFGEGQAAPTIAPALSRWGGRDYRSMFKKTALSSDGWRDQEEFYATIHNGLNDARLKPAAWNAIATGNVPSDGGFSVPEQFVQELLDASLESEIVRPLADVTPMTTSTKHVSGWDAGTAASNVLYGGFSGQWVGEGGEITATTPKMRRITLNAKKLALLTQVSNELLSDGTSYGDQLSAALVKACGWFMDYAFLRGTGAGEPLGVLNDPALISVSAETGQTAATIVYENVANMFARMHPASVNRAVWVANSKVVPQLLSMNMTIGTAGVMIPTLTEVAGRFTMLTRPVLFTEKLPTLGTVGDLLFVDFSQYAIGLRSDMTVDRSAHVGFTSDTTYYRGILRADGMGKWNSAYTPANGDTLSWAVALATRS